MRLDKDRVAAVVNTQFGREMLAEGDRAQAGNPEKEQIWNLLLDEIEPDPEQPRRYFEPTALQELADDIARRGILQPLVVRLLPGEPSRYRIIVGERRWRAARLAGRARVPCLIHEMAVEDIRQAQMVENIVREGLSDVERGLALRTLYEDAKLRDEKVTWDDIARQVGISRVQIHLLSRLSHLPEPIISLIHSNLLSGSHGVELGRLNGRAEKQIVLAQDAARTDVHFPYRLSVTALRRRIDVLLQEDRGGAYRRRSALSDEKILERADDITANLRPDLVPEVRERLRRTAEDILRFLHQDHEALSQLNKPVQTLLSEDRGRPKTNVTEHGEAPATRRASQKPRKNEAM